MSAASAYLDREVRNRGNLTIACETTVTRLLFHAGTCTGVRARQNGEERDLHARHVVLCAGAIHSPALLMRSGVGGPDALTRHGIPVVLDAPGVPPRVRFSMLSEPEDRSRMIAGLRLALELMQDPEVIGLRNELFTAAYSETIRRLNQPTAVAGLGTRLLGAALDGPSSLRHFLIRRGIAHGEVAESVMSSERWLSAAVSARTFGMYHPSGTCRMGDDAEAVVDPRCAVRGIEGLSVIDASVMPNPVRGATNLPVMMIAERASDQMLEQPRGA